MAVTISVLGLILSAHPYLRSALRGVTLNCMEMASSTVINCLCVHIMTVCAVVDCVCSCGQCVQLWTVCAVVDNVCSCGQCVLMWTVCHNTTLCVVSLDSALWGRKWSSGSSIFL